jgi:hypothetical protein
MITLAPPDCSYDWLAISGGLVIALWLLRGWRLRRRAYDLEDTEIKLANAFARIRELENKRWR